MGLLQISKATFLSDLPACARPFCLSPHLSSPVVPGGFLLFPICLFLSLPTLPGCWEPLGGVPLSAVSSSLCALATPPATADVVKKFPQFREQKRGSVGCRALQDRGTSPTLIFNPKPPCLPYCCFQVHHCGDEPVTLSGDRQSGTFPVRHSHTEASLHLAGCCLGTA